MNTLVFTNVKHLKTFIRSSQCVALCVLILGGNNIYGGDIITKNQIAYLQVKESMRSNKASEANTRERNANDAQYQRAQINLGWKQAEEAERANRAREAQQDKIIEETGRHNLATEYQSRAVLGETAKHNRAMEGYQAMQIEESRRHNLIGEQLQNLGLQYNYAALGETKRANLARESENYRSHVAQELETTRANQAREQEAILSRIEQSRHNQATEAQTAWYNQTQAQLKETELARKYPFWTALDTIANGLVSYMRNEGYSGNVQDIIGGIVNGKELSVQERTKKLQETNFNGAQSRKDEIIRQRVRKQELSGYQLQQEQQGRR